MSKWLGRVERELLEIAEELSEGREWVYMKDISLRFQMKKFRVTTEGEFYRLFEVGEGRGDYERYQKNSDKNYNLLVSISRAFSSLVNKGYLKRDWYERVSVRYLCARCGKFFTAPFMTLDVEWGQYIQRDKRRELLCRDCFTKIKNWISKEMTKLDKG